jgi:tetratricopeptide (TPR) repeat protein
VADPRIVAALAADQAGDLDEAAARWRETADLLPREHPMRGVLLHNLARSLLRLWERDARFERLDDAIAAALAAAQSSPADAPEAAPARLLLGVALRERFRVRRDPEDLDAAITAIAQAGLGLGEAAVAGGHEELGNALYSRYELAGSRSDLADAVVHLERAAELVDDDDPDAPAYWSNAASALLARYEVTDERADLDRAIRLLEAAGRAPATASAELLSNLGNAWRLRAVADTSTEDADRAIDVLRAAAELDAAKLGNLASGLLVRFDLVRRIADVDEAVAVIETVIEATAPSHPALPGRLNTLGIALRERQRRRRGGPEDLTRAIGAFERAIALTGAQEPTAAALHANLGNALHQRHDVTGDPADLDAAVRELQLAVDATPPEAADRPMYLNNLGATLAARAGPGDLEHALAFNREALRACPESSVLRATCLVNLAHVVAAVGDDVAGARALYREAVRVGLVSGPAEALAAAHGWSEWARDRGAWEEAADACAAGLRAARILFDTQWLRQDKESWLHDAQGLAADGAFALVARDRLAEAATTLERGRALLVSEQLALGAADLKRLTVEQPELGARFRTSVARIRGLEATL